MEITKERLPKEFVQAKAPFTHCYEKQIQENLILGVNVADKLFYICPYGNETADTQRVWMEGTEEKLSELNDLFSSEALVYKEVKANPQPYELELVYQSNQTLKGMNSKQMEENKELTWELRELQKKNKGLHNLLGELTTEYGQWDKKYDKQRKKAKKWKSRAKHLRKAIEVEAEGTFNDMQKLEADLELVHDENEALKAELDKIKEAHKVFLAESEVSEQIKNLKINITTLEKSLTEVYDAGINGINHVGMANYASRQKEAEDKLNIAMYGEE